MSAFFKPLVNGEINLSIASLPLTLLLPALSHWYSIGIAEKNKVQGGWTNQNPRAFVARLNAKSAMGKKLSDVEELVLRGQAAQQNGFEWWAVWAVAVVCFLDKIQQEYLLTLKGARAFSQVTKGRHGSVYTCSCGSTDDLLLSLLEHGYASP